VGRWGRTVADRASISALRAHAGGIIDQCRLDGQPCVITRQGRPIAVLVPLPERVAKQPAAEVGSATATGERAAEPNGLDPGCEQLALEQALDSLAWGRWDELSEEQRAALMAIALDEGRWPPVGGEGPDDDAGAMPDHGWGNWSGT